jgi:hypothetical protein
MICLGYTTQQKKEALVGYCRDHDIAKTFVLSPKKFYFAHGLDSAEVIEWSEIIMYHTFYRLLQEIDARTLVVVNECLRTQNRYDLTYNCIRNFLNQTSHQIIFQYLPFIDDIQDFMILFDFDTRSRWKRESFDEALLEHCRLTVRPIPIRFTPIQVETDEVLKRKYQKEKARLIDSIGIKDPHTIPRNLYLLSGKAKMRYADNEHAYIGRNNRLKIDTLQTYKGDCYPNQPYTIFEFPHNFIDFADFAALSRQQDFNILVSDLKVDQWYLQRYQQWSERINEGYASLS